MKIPTLTSHVFRAGSKMTAAADAPRVPALLPTTPSACSHAEHATSTIQSQAKHRFEIGLQRPGTRALAGLQSLMLRDTSPALRPWIPSLGPCYSR